MAHGKVVLIGTEYEENLSLRYLASAAGVAGYEAEIVAYDDEVGTDVVRAVLEHDPLVVGISVPFQHRAAELLGIAAALRAAGYRGHVIVGGHFATFEYEAILRAHPAIDSVARHEGEATFVEVCDLVRAGQPPGPIPGLIVRGSPRGKLPLAGAPAGCLVGPKRPLPPLDDLPFPDRRCEAHDVLGVLCAPLVGSRGCYADCSFCCIFAYADNADGARYRMRTPEAIATEMAEDYHRRGVRLFVFHDDNFFVPHAPRNIARYRRLDELLRERGLRDIALVIKCRPNDVDRELFALLKSMGMIRAYVGIETSSDEGIVSLNRRITGEDNRRALELLRELDIYGSFNVLMFDPEATLEGVAKNLDFMHEFADYPFNFCRAEVYAGTPLKEKLAADGRLAGDYLAYTYAMRDAKVELLFRIATTAFYGRNFKSDGIANLNMGLRFDHEVLRRFYPSHAPPDLDRRMRAFSREVGHDTVAHAREALAYVSSADTSDVADVNAFTLALARKIARRDLYLLGAAKALRRELEERARAAGASDPRHRSTRLVAPWASETGRLSTSTGRELSTEILPAPRAGVGHMEVTP